MSTALTPSPPPPPCCRTNTLRHPVFGKAKARQLAVQERLGGLRSGRPSSKQPHVGHIPAPSRCIALHTGYLPLPPRKITVGVALVRGTRARTSPGSVVGAADVVACYRGLDPVAPVPHGRSRSKIRLAVWRLPGDLSVKDGANHPGEGRKLGPVGWVLPPVTWWRRVGQQRRGFPNAQLQDLSLTSGGTAVSPTVTCGKSSSRCPGVAAAWTATLRTTTSSLIWKPS